MVITAAKASPEACKRIVGYARVTGVDQCQSLHPTHCPSLSLAVARFRQNIHYASAQTALKLQPSFRPWLWLAGQGSDRYQEGLQSPHVQSCYRLFQAPPRDCKRSNLFTHLCSLLSKLFLQLQQRQGQQYASVCTLKTTKDCQARLVLSLRDALQADSTPDKSYALLHDFCLVIPYGIALVVLGAVAWIKASTTVGVALAGAGALASGFAVLSLRCYEAGKKSTPFTVAATGWQPCKTSV